MQDSANAAGNLGYTGETCNYIAVVIQPGSATLFKNPQTVLASGHEMILTEASIFNTFGRNQFYSQNNEKKILFLEQAVICM